MMTDIVPTLRKAQSAIYVAVESVAADDISRIFKQAADEIEHLRAIRAELLMALQAVVKVADRQTYEFDLARAAIAKATA